MHGSRGRSPLGSPPNEIDSTATPLTRRERRRLQAAPQEPQFLQRDQEADAPDADTSDANEADFSLATLFARSHSALPDGRPTVLMVCTGNICRSPFAETVLATRLADLEVIVRSAGTHALVGHGMPAPARHLAEQNGVPSELHGGHRARLLTESVMADADLVLTMTGEHATLAVRLAPRRLHRTFTLREFERLAGSLSDSQLREAVTTNANPRSRLSAVISTVADQRGIAPRVVGHEDVVDPYRQSAAVYAQSADEMLPGLLQVERAVRAALE
ncbi:MAG: hypothetical protein WAK00_08330 [Microbacterium sp.]|uniref:arsenate reductase/protein-tyrosine-phosphatase family protein n=1 Tax=Microbacterium sp. TaxID=51671 RepID=UPI003BB0A215